MLKTLEEQADSAVFRTSGKRCSRLRLPLGEGKSWRLRLSKNMGQYYYQYKILKPTPGLGESQPQLLETLRVARSPEGYGEFKIQNDALYETLR